MCPEIGLPGDLRAFTENMMNDERRTKAMDERWLTVKDICKYLNASNETVYKWIEQRAMPGHRLGRRWMFKQNEVDAWVRSGGAADKFDKPDTEQ